MSDNPILVDVLRGNAIESRHRGRYVVVDLNGHIVDKQGDIATLIFPRSAIKALQALPLFETGAAQEFKLTGQELALIISSHGGEKEHVKVAKKILAKTGQLETCLECGAHHPMYDKAAYALAKTGKEPTVLHNNCSGKHSGFVCLATQMDVRLKDYVKDDHPIQRKIFDTLEHMIEYKLKSAPMGIDGCSIPTYAAPLSAWAKGFANLIKHPAGQVLFNAAWENSFYIAGTERYCTRALSLLKGEAFVKTGAEGVFCAALPSLGLGIALKCDDGTTRGAERIMTMLLQKYLPHKAKELEALHMPLKNWNGIEVGRIQAA